MKQMVHLISVSLYRPEWEDSRPWSLFEDTALQDVDKNQPWQEQPLFERLNIKDNLNGAPLNMYFIDSRPQTTMDSWNSAQVSN